jgi:hypothetical protein
MIKTVGLEARLLAFPGKARRCHGVDAEGVGPALLHESCLCSGQAGGR